MGCVQGSGRCHESGSMSVRRQHPSDKPARLRSRATKLRGSKKPGTFGPAGPTISLIIGERLKRTPVRGRETVQITIDHATQTAESARRFDAIEALFARETEAC